MEKRGGQLLENNTTETLKGLCLDCIYEFDNL
jgi:hypothetical protein